MKQPTMPQIVRTEREKRGFFGALFKWFLILFNVLMLIILVAGLANVGDLLDKAGSEAERAGAAVGTTLGIAIILFFWVVGTVILGMLALVTRGSKRVIIEEVSRLVLLLLAVTTSTAYAGDIPKFDVDGYCNRIADQIGGSKSNS